MILLEKHYKNINDNDIHILKNIINKNTQFICIGSNKIIMDSFGPLVGTLLNKKNIQTIGNLSNPITSSNISTLIPNPSNSIVIDSTICDSIDKVNFISFKQEPAFPGGFAKYKHPIGNCKITANTTHKNPNMLNNSTSLEHVLELAITTTELIEKILNNSVNL